MLRRCMTLLLPGLLSACAIVPTGPHVMVLPNVGEPFDQFQAPPPPPPGSSPRQTNHPTEG
jgi:hypothetical protein